MNRALMITAAVLAISLAGCTSENSKGKCIGAFDKGQPNIEYKLSVKNTVLGVIFVETIVVPVVVIADETKCPVE